PDEPVLGFFSASSVQEKRTFVARTQLPREWRRITGYETCFPPDSIKFRDYSSAALMSMTFPVVGLLPPTSPGYLTAPLFCTDCRTMGTNKQPPFW
ncbi:MAG TPA: hypothetical protein VF646_14590, partial [Cytophagales bacterium]